MASYRISGVWKNTDGVVTHYGFHTRNIEENTATRVEKVTKAEAVIRLEISSNSATTWVWNYKLSKWSVGENIEVVHGSKEKYLRSNPDKMETNNLGHLINYDWIKP